MATRPVDRLRRYVARSPGVQIPVFLVILAAVLLLAEYSGIFGG